MSCYVVSVKFELVMQYDGFICCFPILTCGMDICAVLKLDHVGWQGVMHGIHGLFDQMTDLLLSLSMTGW